MNTEPKKTPHSALRTPRLIRGWRGVAAALGIVPYKQAVKQKVWHDHFDKELLAHPDFPKPAKPNHWPKEAVLAFRSRIKNVRSKDGKFHDWEILPKPETRNLKFEKGIGQLPAKNNGQSDSDLPFVELSPEEMLRNRLKFNLDIYLNPHLHINPATGVVQKLKDSEIEELRQAGMLPKITRDDEAGQDGADFNYPDTVDNLSVLAGYYKKKFEPVAGRAFTCNKQTIQHWQAGTGVPPGKPWHPRPDAANRFDLPACFKWFETAMLPKFQRKPSGDLPNLGDIEDINAMKEQEERDQILFNRWERAREQGDYVHRTIALATGVAAVKRIHLLVKTEDERNLPKMRMEKLASLGVAPEAVSAFAAWDKELARSITDRRESAMQHIAVTLPQPEKKN